MAYANGRLPNSVLAPIPGGRLRRDAAAAYNAMSAESRRRHGVTMTVTDSYRVIGSPGDYARGRWSQWYAWERYRYHGGNLAAVPGTSNHGWGLAVDVPWAVRQIIDQIGERYGYKKSWSDAPSEWWHIRYRPGVWHGQVPAAPDHQGVAVVQQLLRAHGYHSVGVDGRVGPATTSALRRFQADHRLHVSGQPDKATVAALRKAPLPRKPAAAPKPAAARRPAAPRPPVRPPQPVRPAPRPAAAPVPVSPEPARSPAMMPQYTPTPAADAAPSKFPANRVVAALGPVIALASAAGAAWLSTHFPGLNVPESDTAQAITQGLSFLIGAAIPALLQFKWLEGHQRWEAGQQQLQLAAMTQAASPAGDPAYMAMTGPAPTNGAAFDQPDFAPPLDPWAQVAASPFDTVPGQPGDG